VGGGDAIVQYALQYKGMGSYFYGATRAGLKDVMTKYGGLVDCSSFVYGVFADLGITVPSSSSSYSKTNGHYVCTTNETSLMQPGDIVRWNGHVELYIGDGQCIGIGSTNNPIYVKKLSALVGYHGVGEVYRYY
jgi:cell wall-associated NlpC family hydrolase